MRPLVSNDCEGKCDWRPTGEQLVGEPLFECGHCHSEWVPTETWTPCNQDGELAQEVKAAREARPTAGGNMPAW